MIQRLALLLVIAGCTADGPPLSIDSPYAFEPVLGDIGAVYFTVENRASTPDTLIGVEVAGALVAMIHEQVATGDRVEMRHVGPLAIPARGTVELKPGGYHVMIEGMAHPPASGDTLHLTVRFARAGELRVEAPVLAYGTEP